MLMLPISYIHGFEAGRRAASGGAVEARKRAVGGSELPPPTGCKWLRIREFGAKVAGGHKARLCPATGQGRALSCAVSSDGNEMKSIIIIQF